MLEGSDESFVVFLQCLSTANVASVSHSCYCINETLNVHIYAVLRLHGSNWSLVIVEFVTV